MGARGRVKAERYSWEDIAQKAMDYYVFLLEKPKSQVT
jgi:hypothetical protein